MTIRIIWDLSQQNNYIDITKIQIKLDLWTEKFINIA